MDRKRTGQGKRRGNTNQQGPRKGKGGVKAGFKNRSTGNVKSTLRTKQGTKGRNLGRNPAMRSTSGGGGAAKVKTTTITRTVNDLRQLIRPKKNDSKPAVRPKKKSGDLRQIVGRKNNDLRQLIRPKPKSRRPDSRLPVATAATGATPIIPPALLLSTSRSKVRGYSVVISNLKAGITQKDVEDLFGDIGPVSVQMVDSHTGIVTYGDPNHASQAVDIYHNRLLDGYPMICTLIPALPQVHM